jgi:hypothetical protein
MRQSSPMAKKQKTPRKINETRFQNFNLVLHKYAETDNDGPGMLSRFSQKIDTNENYVSQVKNKEKNPGPLLCRRIEKAFHLPDGWMDEPHHWWEPRDTGERFFIESAVSLFRDVSAEDKQEMMRNLSDWLKRHKR